MPNFKHVICHACFIQLKLIVVDIVVNQLQMQQQPQQSILTG